MTVPEEIFSAYMDRYNDHLVPMAGRLERYVSTLINEQKLPRIDRISARPKSPVRFAAKAQNHQASGKPKYQNPLEEIQDQIGLRVIVFYLSDVDVIEQKIIKPFFCPIERRDVKPDDHWTFSYFGRHFVLQLPDEVFEADADRDVLPFCFEMQVKTLFQHAWSEAGHDLAYKPMLGKLSDEDTRRLAFTSAQAWGADQIFDELFKNLAAKEIESKTETD